MRSKRACWTLHVCDDGARRSSSRKRVSGTVRGVASGLSWPTWITRRSWVPTPIVRSPSVTSTAKRSLRSSSTSWSIERTMHSDPSRAAATCLTQTSKPTVAEPSGSCSNARIAEFRSIIAIIPGVERTLEPIVPPTSVRRRSSTLKVVRALGADLELHQHMPMPPETPSVSPVMYEESSEERKATTAATSSGVPMRRSCVPGLHVVDDLLADLAELERLHQERRLDRPRADRVHGDPEARPFASHRLREAQDAALRGRVGHRALRADPPRLGRDVHDAPVARVLHSGQHRVGARQDADQVDGDHPLPHARVGVGEEAELVGPGVVHEDRERAVRLDQRDCRRRDRSRRGERRRRRSRPRRIPRLPC